MKNTSLSLSLSFILLTILHLTSCRDASGPSSPGEPVLSKVFRDGKLQFEYRYNAKKQLEQIREYDLSTGALEHFTEFHYDNRGFLQNHIGYNAFEKPTSNRQYLKTSNGRFTASELTLLIGADSGKVILRNKYEYNKEGKIMKESWCDPETDAEESYRSYYYYPNGNLKRYEYYWTVVPSPEKVAEVIYSPAGDLPPENIRKHRGYPIDFQLYLFFAEQVEYKTFDTALASAGEYHETISDRVYNSQGLITEQTITYKYILPEKPHEIINIRFEYTAI